MQNIMIPFQSLFQEKKNHIILENYYIMRKINIILEIFLLDIKK